MANNSANLLRASYGKIKEIIDAARPVRTINFMPFLLQTAAAANGNGAVLITVGLTSLLVQIVGITTATINFEGSLDDVPTWVAVGAKPASDFIGGTAVTTTAADGIWKVPVLGLRYFRARISGWSAGTIQVTASICTQ